jgi:hypothetical protein
MERSENFEILHDQFSTLIVYLLRSEGGVKMYTILAKIVQVVNISFKKN